MQKEEERWRPTIDALNAAAAAGGGKTQRVWDAFWEGDEKGKQDYVASGKAQPELKELAAQRQQEADVAAATTQAALAGKVLAVRPPLEGLPRKTQMRLRATQSRLDSALKDLDAKLEAMRRGAWELGCLVLPPPLPAAAS